MAETGSVKVTIDEEAITRRIRDRLAEVWDEGAAYVHEQGAICMWSLDYYLEDNPYRDSQ